MKKMMALALALMLVLTLAACGGKDAPKSSGSAGSGDTPPASAQQEPATPDPGTTQTKEKEWPDNEWTNLVPQPADATIYLTSELSDTDGYDIRLQDWTLEAAEAYIEEVKEAGFNLQSDWGTMDFNLEAGRDAHRFNAVNSDGIDIEIRFDPSTNKGMIKIYESSN